MARPEGDKWCGRHAKKDDSCPQCTVSLTRAQRRLLGSYYWNSPDKRLRDGHDRRTMKSLVQKGLMKSSAGFSGESYEMTEFGRIVYGRGRGR